MRSTNLPLAALLLAACGGDGPVGPGTPPPSSQPKAAGITLSVAQNPSRLGDLFGNATLGPGDSLRLAVRMLTADSATLEGRPVYWSVSDTTVLLVSESGMVHGRGEGDALVRAHSEIEGGGVSGQILISVRPHTATIGADVDSARLVPGGRLTITVGLRDSLGRNVGNRPFTATSSNPAVATVGSGPHTELTGVTAIAPGAATITLAREGRVRTVRVEVSTVRFDTVAVGTFHACGLTAEGEAWCWGSGTTDGPDTGSPLGTGIPGLLQGASNTNQVMSPTPVPVAGGYRFRAIGAGYGFTCGITEEGATRCWGTNIAQVLGGAPGPGVDRPSAPLAVPPLVTLSLGRDRACGLTAAGEAWCWGSNLWSGYWKGQLGVGSTEQYVAPPARVVGGHVFSAIQVGPDAVCATKADGEGWCWGQNFWTGDLAGDLRMTEPTLLSADLRFRALVPAAGEIVGVTTSGAIVRWGNFSELGSPTVLDDTRTWRAISPDAHACAVASDGSGFCRGLNDSGQLGIGTVSPPQQGVDAFTRVAGGLTFRSIDTGYLTTCGVATDGYTYCWGANFSGQLGRPGPAESAVPERVAGQD